MSCPDRRTKRGLPPGDPRSAPPDSFPEPLTRRRAPGPGSSAPALRAPRRQLLPPPLPPSPPPQLLSLLPLRRRRWNFSHSPSPAPTSDCRLRAKHLAQGLRGPAPGAAPATTRAVLRASLALQLDKRPWLVQKPRHTPPSASRNKSAWRQRGTVRAGKDSKWQSAVNFNFSGPATLWRSYGNVGHTPHKKRGGGAHQIRSAVSGEGLEILRHTVGLPRKMKIFLYTNILKL